LEESIKCWKGANSWNLALCAGIEYETENGRNGETETGGQEARDKKTRKAEDKPEKLKKPKKPEKHASLLAFSDF